MLHWSLAHNEAVVRSLANARRPVRIPKWSLEYCGMTGLEDKIGRPVLADCYPLGKAQKFSEFVPLVP